MNEKMEEKFEEVKLRISESEKFWSNTTRKLTQRLETMSMSSFKDIPTLQAETISNRQLIIDEISLYGAKIYRERQQIKKLEKVRFEFYNSSYPIKTSGPEKLRLILSDLADRQMLVDAYDEHVEHLRECAGHLKEIGYGIKNKLAAYSAIGAFDE